MSIHCAWLQQEPAKMQQDEETHDYKHQQGLEGNSQENEVTFLPAHSSCCGQFGRPPRTWGMAETWGTSTPK